MLPRRRHCRLAHRQTDPNPADLLARRLQRRVDRPRRRFDRQGIISAMPLFRLATGVLLASAAWLCSAPGALAASTAQTQRSPYWHERTSFFKTFGQHADVVMIGDSLTDAAEWREMFPQLSIVNRGIDNDTTDGVLARLDDIAAAKPRLAFVMIGVNDFSNARAGVDGVLSNYRAIVTRLQQAGIKVVIESTLPCNEALGKWKSCKAINGKIRELDEQLAKLASADVAYANLAALLTDAHGLKKAFTYDGVHLNGAGYRVWRDTIAHYMTDTSARPSLKK
jgi:lysophospholipase L1-like esterase